MNGLSGLQRWFLRAVLPGGAPRPRGVRRSIEGGRLSPEQRFRIYREDCRSRLLGSLAEDFPSLKRYLGGRLFRRLAFQYLRSHPSRSFTLRDMGERMAEFCARSEILSEPQRRAGSALAVLEWAAIEVFGAAESKSLRLDSARRLTAASRLYLTPAIRLLSAPKGATEYLLENTRRRAWPAGREFVAVFRHGGTVFFRRLSAGEWRVLKGLESGLTLGEALARAGRGFQPQQRFQEWASLGWFCEPPILDLGMGEGK